MSKIETLCKELRDIAANPSKSIDELKKTGKKLVGMGPEYSPDEIAIAAGAYPIGIWGGQKSIQKARAELPPFVCSIMQSMKEFELKGTYDNLDAVIFPSLCDTLKCMGQKWKGKAPIIQFSHPQMRIIDASIIYLSKEYKSVAERLEKVLGVKITEAQLNDAIEVCNANRVALQEFVEVAANHPDKIKPADRHMVIKARYFMDRADHTAKIKELTAELKAAPVVPWKGKKVILTGITAEPVELLDIFDKFDMAVVADDLAQESRQFRTLVPEGNDPYERLAKQWQNIKGCSLAGDVKKAHGPMLMDMLKEKGADAIIVCMMKFCDPEEFDYAVYNTQFDEAGVKHLFIEIDQEATSFEQARTRIQSFSEML